MKVEVYTVHEENAKLYHQKFVTEEGLTLQIMFCGKIQTQPYGKRKFTEMLLNLIFPKMIFKFLTILNYNT